MKHFALSTKAVLALVLAWSFGSAHAAPNPPAPACPYDGSAVAIPDLPTPGEIALTFDDGPNPDTTPHVLDVLKKYNIKATFFLIGENIKGNEKLVERELREGHNIGNHTWTHPHMPTVHGRAMRSQIRKTDSILKKFPKNRARVMRFPYGESSCEAADYVESLHYNIVGWHVDSCDWSYGEGIEKSDCVDPELQKEFGSGYQGWIDHQLKETKGGVFLMHDAEEYEAKHLEEEIIHLKSLGYTFVELDRGNHFPKLIKDHTGWTPADNKKAALSTAAAKN